LGGKSRIKRIQKNIRSIRLIRVKKNRISAKRKSSENSVGISEAAATQLRSAERAKRKLRDDTLKKKRAF